MFRVASGETQGSRTFLHYDPMTGSQAEWPVSRGGRGVAYADPGGSVDQRDVPEYKPHALWAAVPELGDPLHHPKWRNHSLDK